MILCTMPGCDTAAGCQCRRGYREINHFWQDQHGAPSKRAPTVEALRKAFEAGRVLGRKEAERTRPAKENEGHG